MSANVVYFALFWVAALLALLFFITGSEGLAALAIGAAVASLAWALVLDHRRRRRR